VTARKGRTIFQFHVMGKKVDWPTGHESIFGAEAEALSGCGPKGGTQKNTIGILYTPELSGGTLRPFGRRKVVPPKPLRKRGNETRANTRD